MEICWTHLHLSHREEIHDLGRTCYTRNKIIRSLIQILTTATSYMLVGTTEVMFWHANCSAIISYTSIGQANGVKYDIV